MSDLSSITRRLQYGVARVVTPTEAAAAQSATGSTNPDKYVTINTSRSIQRVPVNLVIPQHTFSYSYGTGYPPQRLLFMYTVSMPNRFYFTKPITAIAASYPWYGFLAVRYRVGNVGHRYFLYGTRRPQQLFGSNIPEYNGEVIEANCCIEFWSYKYYVNPILSPSPYTAGMPYDVTLETSLLRVPETNDQINQNIVLAQLVSFADMKLAAFPWASPVSLDNEKCAFEDGPVPSISAATSYKVNWSIQGTIPQPVIGLSGQWRERNGLRQCYNPDTGLWHTVAVTGNPPTLTWDSVGIP